VQATIYKARKRLADFFMPNGPLYKLKLLHFLKTDPGSRKHPFLWRLLPFATVAAPLPENVGGPTP